MAMLVMQELVRENGEIVVVPNKQFRPGEEVDNTIQEKRISFGQVFISHPNQAGRDGQGEAVMPQHARLRNLTYAAPLKVLMTVKDVKIDGDTGEVLEESESSEFRAFIGNLPIMLKSTFCHLCRDGILEDDPAAHGECQFDQGGYFIINGAEKVVIAQVIPFRSAAGRSSAERVHVATLGCSPAPTRGVCAGGSGREPRVRLRAQGRAVSDHALG
jgi:DNA-directed RNA polymerase II subunit RPB2